MTWPIRIWLSIVFAFLLVNETWTSETSTEKPFEQETGGDENYDVIDVANEQSNGEYDKLLTGQTTRIILTGDVDDDFWLKHLGEDYKHAIHLVVGNQEQYRDEYHEGYYEANHDDYNQNHNITNNHHHATVTHAEDYVEPKEYPVENIELENVENPKENANYTTASINVALESTGSSSSSSRSNTTEQVKTTELELTNVENDAEEPNYQMVMNKSEPVAANNLFEEQAAYERIFAMEDDTNLKLANTFYNPNSFYMPDEKPNKHLHYTDTPHKYSTQIKYTQPESYTNTYTNPQPKGTHTEDQEHNDAGSGDQLTQANYSTPSAQNAVIVNLPETDNTIIQQQGEQDTPVVVKMPPVIYHQNSQQYSSPPTQQQYIPQILPYPLSQGYPNYYHQTQAPQQHYGLYHNSYYRPNTGGGYDPLAYNGQSFYEPPRQNTEDSLKSLRYYLSKLASTGQQYAAAQDQPQHEEEGSGSNDESSRVSRSNQQLFEDGL